MMYDHTQVTGFNSSVVPETIADLNDPDRVEWTTDLVNRKFIVGDKVSFMARMA